MTNINIIYGTFHLNIHHGMSFTVAAHEPVKWYVDDIGTDPHFPNHYTALICNDRLVSKGVADLEDWQLKKINKVELRAFIECNGLNVEVFDTMEGEYKQEYRVIPVAEYLDDYLSLRDAITRYLNRKVKD